MQPIQKSILITGCSSGIGHACAHYLRDRGWRVFASCRKEQDCDRLIAEGFESPRIDYENPDTIQTGCNETMQATDGKLGAVFNNGAYAIPGAVEDLPVDALRAIFEANFFGYHDLTTRLLPVFRSNRCGRIVNCSSVLGLVPYAVTRRSCLARRVPSPSAVSPLSPVRVYIFERTTISVHHLPN